MGESEDAIDVLSVSSEAIQGWPEICKRLKQAVDRHDRLLAIEILNALQIPWGNNAHEIHNNRDRFTRATAGPVRIGPVTHPNAHTATVALVDDVMYSTAFALSEWRYPEADSPQQIYFDPKELIDDGPWEVARKTIKDCLDDVFSVNDPSALSARIEIERCKLGESHSELATVPPAWSRPMTVKRILAKLKSCGSPMSEDTLSRRIRDGVFREHPTLSIKGNRVLDLNLMPAGFADADEPKAPQ